MKLFYTDHFVLPLPAGHRFPMAKYALLRARVSSAGLVPPHQLLVPEAATRAQLASAHDEAYIDRVLHGHLDAAEQRRIGFPWSAQLVERSLRSVGATIAAARAALQDGCSVNLAGGTHHACADRGEGYCVFNDVAVAIRTLQQEQLVTRAAVIDCDVHQGNGTAALFRDDPSVFTFSVHGERNYPFRKEASTLDIALPDGTGDDAFLDAVAAGVAAARAAGDCDVMYYIAGADAHEGDRLGRLKVSKAALQERDRLVLAPFRRAGVPVVVVMGGGYGAAVADTVDIHFNSVRLAADLSLVASSTTL